MEDSNDTAFLTAIQKVLPDTKLFASGIISTSLYPEKDFEPRNTAIKTACASVSNCTYIDLSNKWNETNYRKYISGDGVHPSDEGHEFLAEEYAKAIKPYINNYLFYYVAAFGS
jgi:lysophospholipase L1-like esterase